MITLNKLTRDLCKVMRERDEFNEFTSPKLFSILISRAWRRYDACHPKKPPLHLDRDFVETEHQGDARSNWTHEWPERMEHAADIIIDTAIALERLGCENIEQLLRDRIAWRSAHKD